MNHIPWLGIYLHVASYTTSAPSTPPSSSVGKMLVMDDNRCLLLLPASCAKPAAAVEWKPAKWSCLVGVVREGIGRGEGRTEKNIWLTFWWTWSCSATWRCWSAFEWWWSSTKQIKVNEEKEKEEKKIQDSRWWTLRRIFSRIETEWY